MKKWWLILVAAFAVHYGVILYTSHKVEEEKKVLVNNQFALISQRDSVHNSSIEYQLKLDQMKYFNDSIMTKMLELKDQLNIKDKEIKKLGYVESSFMKTDTVVFVDTIFRDINFKVDTVISDEWSSQRLQMEYPGTIIMTPSFRSEKFIVTTDQKVFVKPRSKVFFVRWFQKKQQMIFVDVYERSPYVENEKQQFIEIIK